MSHTISMAEARQRGARNEAEMGARHSGVSTSRERQQTDERSGAAL